MPTDPDDLPADGSKTDERDQVEDVEKGPFPDDGPQPGDPDAPEVVYVDEKDRIVDTGSAGTGR